MEALYYTLNDGEFQCSGQSLTKIPSQIDADTSKITCMDLSSNKISSLKGLENYKVLETLILDSNLIGNSYEFSPCPSLTTLSLNKNLITDLDLLLDNLKKYVPSLKYLSLLGNQACPHQLLGLDYDENDYYRYRCYVIYCLPHLKFLDSSPVTKDEKEEAIIRGQYFRIAKPCKPTTRKYHDFQNAFIEDDRNKLMPLPPAKCNLKPHRGIYGACRYRYTGKNSEGNRFIRNHDL